MTTDRHIPPQCIEAEMSILGAVFVENDSINRVLDTITPEDLYRGSHRKIFRAMAELSDKGEPIDLITMTSLLKGKGQLEDIGGGAYLATLVDYVPIAGNIAYYCRIVAQKAQERKVLANALEAARIVREGGNLEEAVSKLEAAIQPTVDKRHNAPVTMSDAVQEAAKRIEQRHETHGTIQGLPYGLAALDKATSGMHPGELVIIAGRPSMGKSALAGNILAATGAAGKSAILFTLEMSSRDIIDRLVAGFGIRYQNIRSGQFCEAEWTKLTGAMSKIHNWPLAIDDTPGISLREIRSKARRVKREGLDLVVIDYLQLMTLPSKENRVQALGEVSRGLKQLARELDVPVVALSQLNRGVDARQDKRPTMSDLRDSGEIEQDADVILFPFREAAYCAQCRDRVDDKDHKYREHQAKAEIIIEKQRAGERNISVSAVWLGEYQKFVEVHP